MMTKIIFNLLEIIIGFSSGFLVGSAYLALLIVLGVIPRMIQLVNHRRFISYLIIALLLGVFLGTYFSFSNQFIKGGQVVLLIWGLFHGIFNGMLAAALVEVLNVFPLLSRRLQLENYMVVLLTALIFGKVVGSLVQFFYFVDL